MLDKRISALIVEDSDVDLWLLDFMLKKIGEVEILATANNGNKGIELIEKYAPELVFLDLDLPGTSGLELARIVQQKNIKISIVFITAFEQYANEVLEFKPLDYLVKPITLETLKDVIARFKAARN